MRFALLLLLVARVATADTDLYHCQKSHAKVEVSFKPDTDLQELVAWAMGFSCKTFMYDPSLVARGKKISLMSPEPMTPDQAYAMFLGALDTMGYTVVERGGEARIVEKQTARTEALPMYAGGTGPGIVRTLVRPAHASPQVIASALAALKSTAGDIQVVGSFVLVTDSATHVRDMLDIVKQIDEPPGESGVYTIPVLHADAANLATELQLLDTAAAGPGADKTAPGGASTSSVPPTKIVVDARTNTLIVQSSPAGYQRVKAIVDRVDLPVETETGGEMHIYPLKAAIADEVAKTLQAAIDGQSQAQPARGSAPGTRPGAAASSSPDALALEGHAHVIADAATNKLIVMASGRDFTALRHVIDELDEPRREVYIEAVIVDIEGDDTTALGVSAHGTVPTSSTNPSGIVVGGVQTGSLSSTNPASLATATGLVGGILGNALTGAAATQLLGTSFPSYGVLFQALATIDHTHAFSAPSIIALDNEEAKYSVGKTIPVIKGTVPVSSANPTGLVTTNVEDVDLTLELDIKPHISEGDDVLLEVKHQQKEEAGSDPTLGPSWTTRTIETRVVAHDQQTVMLTGLAQVKDIYEKTKVPVLGDLPVLGVLFSYTKKERVTSNLVILLTPYIIRDRLDIDQIRERHQREQEELVETLRTFDATAFQPHVDYKRKRGLVEEIDRAVQSVDEDAAARAALHALPPVPSGPVL